MPFYVYIIRSELYHTYYKGFSESPVKRLSEHNDGGSKYTSAKVPWQLVYIEELLTKREAVIREKGIEKVQPFPN